MMTLPFQAIGRLTLRHPPHILGQTLNSRRRRICWLSESDHHPQRIRISTRIWSRSVSTLHKVGEPQPSARPCVQKFVKL
jgi:hypothetical protein